MSRTGIVAAVMLAASCGGAKERALYDCMGPRYEASDWIGSNGNPFCLASNRFASRDEAAGFVESLYAAGAETVWVLNVMADGPTLSAEGGPYADALLVRLPAAVESRAALFAIAGREARREGFEPESDSGQRYLFLWWD